MTFILQAVVRACALFMWSIIILATQTVMFATVLRLCIIPEFNLQFASAFLVRVATCFRVFL